MLIDRVVDARVPGHESPCTLQLSEGRVVGMVPASSGRIAGGDAEGDPHGQLSAGGRLLVPAFVDAHVHLDKAFLLDLIPGSAPSLVAAIEAVAGTRGTMALEGVRGRAERAVGLLVRHGATAARVHVEIDPSIGLDFVHMHRALVEAVADRIELQLVAFPQRGLEAPGMVRLMDAAMAAGVAVVGGCPYVDADPRGHIDTVFALAEKYGAPIDFHLDFTDDARQSLLPLVAERVRAHGMGGQVAIGHVTTLAAMPAGAQAAALDLLAEAGISLIVLPATDLYLGGHGEPGTRSLAPIDRARAAGVRVAIANNNLQNPFAPFGNGNLVQAAWLAGIVRRASTPSMRGWLFEAITSEPAAILGLPPHGPAVGAAAHIAVVDAGSVDELVTLAPPVVATLRAGRLVHAMAGLRASSGHDAPYGPAGCLIP